MTDRIYISPRARITILWMLATIVLLFLWEVRDILTPFIWAIVTAYVLNPVVMFLAKRTNVPRRVWAVALYVALLGLLAWTVTSLTPIVGQQIRELGREMPGHFREAGKLLGQREINLLGIRVDLNAPDSEIRQQIDQIFSQVGRTTLTSALPHLAESFLKMLVYLVATFFLLLEAKRIGENINRFTPDTARHDLGPWIARINHVLGAYIRGQMFLVMLMSVTSYIGLTLLDVRFALALAIFTGLVETMPFIGPYIAGGTAVLVALTQGYAPYGWSPTILAVSVAIMYTVLRQLEDNFVMPFLIGRLVHLHPLIIIFAVLSGAALGNILGLLVAVPFAATIKIVITYLYHKFQEEPARTLVMIEPEDTWDAIAERIREGARTCTDDGSPRPRLTISIPYPPASLLEPSLFHRLPALLKESNADAVLISSDPLLIALASEAHIVVRHSVALTTTAPLDDLVETRSPFGRSRRKAVQESS
ncbi:MAG: AI-2E family transporter [Chloroflexota bacterium]|nr:AI-2E family transporter [Chloroflexota bacterium]